MVAKTRAAKIRVAKVRAAKIRAAMIRFAAAARSDFFRARRRVALDAAKAAKPLRWAGCPERRAIQSAED
jgi:hypothetical protein